MGIGTIVGYVVLGLGILTALFLLIFLIVGATNGFGRALNKLIALAGAAIVFFCCFNLFTNIILNIKVDMEVVKDATANINPEAEQALEDQGYEGEYTVQEVITQVVTNAVYKDDPTLAENSKVEGLVKGLVQMVLKIVVYIVGLLIVLILYNVFRFILWILRSIIYRKQIEKKHHLLGLPVGLVAFLIIFVLFITPVYGLLSTASVIAKDVATYGAETETIDKDTCFQLEEASSKVENSIVRKIAYGAITNMFYKDSNFSADAHYIANILSFDTEDGTFSIINDYDTISTALPSIFKVYNLVNEAKASGNKVVKLSSLSAEEIDKIADIISDSSLLKVFAPAIGEYLSYSLLHNEELQLTDAAKQAATQLRSVNWETELTNIADIIRTLKDYNEVEFSVENTTELLKSKKFIDMCETVINKFLDLEIVTDIALPIAADKIIDSLKDNTTAQELNLDTEALKQLAWKTEIKTLLSAVFEVARAYQDLDFDEKNWSSILDNPDLSTYVDKVIDKVLESKALKEQIIPGLSNKINTLVDEMEGMNLSFVKSIITEDSIVNLLENDVDTLIDILKELKGIGLFEDGAKLDLTVTANQDALINVVKEVFTISVVQGKEADIFKGIMDLAGLQEKLTEYGVTLKFDSVTDWDQEIDNICDIFKNAMEVVGNFDNFSLDTLLNNTKDAQTKEKVANIIDGISKSEIMGDSMFDIINKMLSAMDDTYAVTFTPADKLAIENETGWKQETLVILNIVDDAASLLENSNLDYASLDAQVIKDIMLEAGQGVVASKVVGNVLNELFKDNLDYDFTVRANMLSCADTVYSTIVLAQTMSNGEFDLADPTNTAQIISALDSFAANEENITLINDIINEALVDTSAGDTEINLTQQQIKDVSGVMQDVFTEYQGLDPAAQENFQITDLPPEVQDEIEDNELAELLLKYYFG